MTTMELYSPDFQHLSTIPPRFTCEGEDISPQLTIMNIPSKAKSLALIVDDPDAPDPKAPKMTWVHWILYNIPPNISVIPRAVKNENLPSGTLIGLNDWKKPTWGGPCPPIGEHRYFFKLYALDKMLDLVEHATKKELENKMKGCIIARSELIGVYEKE